MVKRKRDIKVEFVGQRLLSDPEADQVRELAASFKPRVHLVLPAWRYCEIRGIREEAAAKVIEALKGMGLRFREL
jgi:hypothetical protein